MADVLLGKLKRIGNQLENVGKEVATGVGSGLSKVGGTVVDTAGLVGDTVASGVISVARDVKGLVLSDAELDRIRELHAFQRAHIASGAGPARRRTLTEQEHAAADERAAAVLAGLQPGYFEDAVSFDPVRAELLRLGDVGQQEQVDMITDKLGACVEVHGYMKLSLL
jgi:hypothetical protein